MTTLAYCFVCGNQGVVRVVIVPGGFQAISGQRCGHCGAPLSIYGGCRAPEGPDGGACPPWKHPSTSSAGLANSRRSGGDQCGLGRAVAPVYSITNRSESAAVATEASAVTPFLRGVA